MASRRRPLCSDVSRAKSEPLSATASRLDHWLLVEYSGLWARKPLTGQALGEQIKAHLRDELSRVAPARLLFIKRPERRGERAIKLYFGTTLERQARFFERELDAYTDLLGLDLTDPRGADPLDHPLFVVCTHGKRDRCCAVYGRPLYDAARHELDEDWVWQSTHVGGDRFAGNVVLFPPGLYFGRVGPTDASPLIEACLAGQVPLDHYRGRCCYSFAEQAAERALREELELLNLDDLALARTRREGDAWKITFRTPNGELHEKTVLAEFGESVYLTCDAEVPRRPRLFRATD
jgi:hypothetical protein